MKKIIVFVDESGNAGANLIDKQPFFTLVGMAIDEQRIESIQKEYIELERQTGFEGEVKGSGAIKGGFTDFVIPAVNLVLSNNLPIFWSVIERRFMIACIIVDNFFDDAFNNSVTSEWMIPSQKRQDLANHFYDNLSDETMSLAYNALTYGNSTQARLLIEKIEAELAQNRVVHSFDVVSLLSGVLPNIDNLCDVIALSGSRSKNDPLRTSKYLVRTPNVTSFFEMINRIEDHYRGGTNSTVELVFDSSKQFDEVYGYLHNILSNAKDGELRFSGYSPIIFGFKHLKSFTSADSKNEPLLRAVDLFSAGIRLAFELIAAQYPPLQINESLRFFLGFIGANIQTPLYNYVISDSVAKKIFPAFKRYFPSVNPK